MVLLYFLIYKSHLSLHSFIHRAIFLLHQIDVFKWGCHGFDRFMFDLDGSGVVP